MVVDDAMGEDTAGQHQDRRDPQWFHGLAVRPVRRLQGAVSYTQLDVYKRQDRIPDDSEKGADGRPAGSLARQRTEALSLIHISAGAVG